jgi:hypothetical protein
VISHSATSKDWTTAAVASTFTGARKKDAETVLDSLAALGLVVSFSTGSDRSWRPAM